MNVREFNSVLDWDRALEIVRDEEHLNDNVAAVDFAVWRLRLCQRDAEIGRCRVWGAFCADSLIAFAGLYGSDDYARFITPITQRAYRRRGLFRALCRTIIHATSLGHPEAQVVVVATTGTEPEQVYSRLGFTVVGQQFALIAPI